MDLDRVLNDPDGVGLGVDLGPAQAGQLADAQPAIGGDEDQRAVAGVDGVGELRDLHRCQEPHLLALDTRQLDPPARRLSQQSGVDRAPQHLAERLVGLVDRRRRQARGGQAGDPASDVEDADGVESHPAEPRQHVVAEV
ncbi:MAG TPA: hypothetical protein VFH30_15210 [Acidimicrobiales bacterium]|nr:hypothetical protein [Acidimicrobiales bacterium]